MTTKLKPRASLRSRVGLSLADLVVERVSGEVPYDFALGGDIDEGEFWSRIRYDVHACTVRALKGDEAKYYEALALCFRELAREFEPDPDNAA